jgi:hypothetical protein
VPKSFFGAWKRAKVPQGAMLGDPAGQHLRILIHLGQSVVERQPMRRQLM